MTQSAHADLAAAYIAFAHAAEDSAEYEANFWAFERFADLCLEQPDEAWHAILDVLSHDPNPRVIGMLAAGPMEELLVHHGAVIIDRVEERARNDRLVATLLGGVWKKGIKDDVWKRVEAVRSHVW